MYYSRGLEVRVRRLLDFITSLSPQVELKESDRSLLEIFKQLQGDVAELGELCTERQRRLYSSSSLNRYSTDSVPTFDHLGTRQNLVTEDAVFESYQELESTLTSSKEPSPSLELADDNVFHRKPSCSTHGSDSGVTDSPPSPATRPLKGGQTKISHSPTNISRNSSVDSGIQFASESDVNRTDTETDPSKVEDGGGLGSLADDIFSMLGTSSWLSSSS